MSETDKKRPITAAQAEARRNNGKRYSTGPKTEAGKQASSRNAVRHGLWGKVDPVVDTGIFAEDPAAFDDLREGLYGTFDVSSPLAAELVEQLAAVLWRLRRVPAIEALLLQEEDSLADRLADRAREEVEAILQIEDYLRHGGYPLGENEFLVMMSFIHHWAGWAFGEEWGVDDPAPATEPDRVAQVGHLLARRWDTWEQAADYALSKAQERQEEVTEELRGSTIRRAKNLVDLEFLSKLNRPEAHLARERDRLLGQIRAEEARHGALD